MIRIKENDVRRDIEAVTRYLTTAQRSVVPAATVAALNKTADRAKTDTVRALAAKYRVPAKVVRGRVKRLKANRRTLTAWISAKVQAIKAVRVGKPRQQKKGARAGKHFFTGGFVATMKSGHVGIYKRKDTARLPIAEQVIKMPDGESIASRNTHKRARTTFPQLFLHELRWRLSRLRS